MRSYPPSSGHITGHGLGSALGARAGSACSREGDSGVADSGSREPLIDPFEERAPAVGRALVLLGRHRPALFEAHLGPLVAEVSEHDCYDLKGAGARLIGHGEDE